MRISAGESHGHHAGLNHLFYHALNLLGVADHQGGIIILIALLFLRFREPLLHSGRIISSLSVYDSSFRHLAVELGGAKRLHSLVSLFSLVILAPLAVLVWSLGSAEVREDPLQTVVSLLESKKELSLTDSGSDLLFCLCSLPHSDSLLRLHLRFLRRVYLLPG